MKNTQITKLYTVTRRDLSAGQQLAQSLHSISDFSVKHPETFKKWNLTSNYIVALSTENEESLKNIIGKLDKEGIEYTAFVEPDLNNEITSITISPEATEWCSRYLSSLPLAMKEYDVLSNQSKEETV